MDTTPVEDGVDTIQGFEDVMDVDGWIDDDEGTVGEDVLHAMRDFLGDRWNSMNRQGKRTWRQRLERADANWSGQLEELIDAYLVWRYPTADGSRNTENGPKCPISVCSPGSTGPPSSSQSPTVSSPAPASISRASAMSPPRSTDHEGATGAGRADATPMFVPPPCGTAAVSGTLSGVITAPSTSSPVIPSPTAASPTTTPSMAASAVAPVIQASQASPPPHGLSGAATTTPDTRQTGAHTTARIQDANIQRDAAETAVIAMARQGYLATTPISPTLAITFNTLEHFRLLRLRKPSFSLEAFAKVLCDSYFLPYQRRYRTALSDCFDMYLSILLGIEKRVDAALKRDSPDWRVMHSCPACCYKVEDELPLKFDRLLCMDGNNSLKRVAKFGDREVSDMREFTASNYFLPNDFVDKFKNEVQDTEPSDHDQPHGADQGDQAPQSRDDPRDCTRNWKAAGREQDKTMWGIFHESGIFASACRHGFILWVTDMIKSGELAKYPLAVVAKVLEVLGPRQLIGYDIGCVFGGTISRSSLGLEFRKLDCRCCVDAFHGYSHNHRCQTQHHPSVIEGAGIEDLGGMERIFSASNQLASVTRYASRYHRRVIIDIFFKQWDDDKYVNLATMLLNNYKQALKIIEDYSVEVDATLIRLDSSRDDLVQWQEEEAAYFASVGHERPGDIAAVEYVTLLRELRGIESQLASSMAAFVTSIPEDYSFVLPEAAGSSRKADSVYYAATSRTRIQESERVHLREKWDKIHREVVALELKMGITIRWGPGTTEYMATLQYIAERDYHVALEKLHGLVVQRLFELHNMNISQTAYKVRTYIAKNLQRRSEAIRTAVKQYNTAAQALVPPRPALDWAKVTHYTFLDEFELLRDTRNDIRTKPWAQPLARETMKKYRRILRAREELVRCDIEVCRLHTWIIDEQTALDCAVREAHSRRDHIAGPLDLYRVRRKQTNARLLAVISQLYALDGFSGRKGPWRACKPLAPSGPPEGASVQSSSAGENPLQDALEGLSLDVDEYEEGAIDDSELAEIGRVVEFAANIS
ncbi:hypothetical protein C8Q78DRAFT_1014194 [Trametes maxima]|nr:hypothetical protein C8Q78DRAFT_1014194 [Trametes maxima]